MSTPQPSKDELLARAGKPGEEALRLHPFYRGKMQTTPSTPSRSSCRFSSGRSAASSTCCR